MSHCMHSWTSLQRNMMMSSNGNIFRITGPLWGESTGHRWIPLTKASDVKIFSLICAGVNVWANWYLRCHYARYDVTVMNMMNSRYVEQLLTYEFIKGYKHRIYGPIKDVCKKVIGAGLLSSWCVNTLRPKPNGWHFADNIFRRIWLNSYLCILIWMTLILGSRKVLIDNNSACNHLMAWSSTDKPLVEQGWRRSLMNICIIKPGWVKTSACLTSLGLW